MYSKTVVRRVLHYNQNFGSLQFLNQLFNLFVTSINLFVASVCLNTFKNEICPHFRCYKVKNVMDLKMPLEKRDIKINIFYLVTHNENSSITIY